ncbi:MAG: hypothetical protein NZL85_11165 [Fimbriimonadales bacterium]|nr:hypothetical protein [Fimbriimonadales bacterium]
MRGRTAIGVVFVLLASVSIATAQIASELARGGRISWRFLSGNYEITGAITQSGNVTASDPVSFALQDLNNDGVALDVILNLSELLGNVGLNYQIPLIASVISDSPTTAIVRWTGSRTLGNPQDCIPVNIGTTVNVLITYVEGSLQGQVTRVNCLPDPLGRIPHRTTLQVVPNGGDTHNYLRVQGYLFCIQQPGFLINARIFNMNWIGYGGGIPRSLGNVNGDCIVDDADLLAVLFAFGQTGTNLPEDTNGDGVVDDADLLTVLFNFGAGG